MKTTYECEVCGFKSEDKLKIQKCEAQRKDHKFAVEQEIVFLLGPGGLRVWTRGAVKGISFQERSHESSYRVLITGDLQGTGFDDLEGDQINLNEEELYTSMEEVTDLENVYGVELLLKELKAGNKLELTFKRDGFRGASWLSGIAESNLVKVDYLHDLVRAIEAQKWEHDRHRFVTVTITHRFHSRFGPSWFISTVCDLEAIKIIRR